MGRAKEMPRLVQGWASLERQTMRPVPHKTNSWLLPRGQGQAAWSSSEREGRRSRGSLRQDQVSAEDTHPSILDLTWSITEAQGPIDILWDQLVFIIKGNFFIILHTFGLFRGLLSKSHFRQILAMLFTIRLVRSWVKWKFGAPCFLSYLSCR